MCCALCVPLCFLASPVPASGSRNYLTEFNAQDKDPHSDHVMSLNSIRHQATINGSSSEEENNFNSFGLCSSSALTGIIGSRKCPAEIVMHNESHRIPQQYPVVKCLKRKWKKTRCEEVKYNVPMLYLEKRQDKSFIYTSIWTSISVGCVESILPSSLTHRMAKTVPPNELL